MLVYRRLWRLLEKEKINRSSLIRIAHISPSTLIRLRENRSVSVESLEKICGALDCGIAEIMEYVGD